MLCLYDTVNFMNGYCVGKGLTTAAFTRQGKFDVKSLSAPVPLLTLPQRGGKQVLKRSFT